MLYRYCLRLSFMELIQKDLNRARSEWNLHQIRPPRTSANPSGHPNELYFLPQILGIQICKSCDQLILYANKHFHSYR